MTPAIRGGEEMLGEPERPREPRRRQAESGGGGGSPRRRSGETLRRILFAIPWVAFAIAIIVAGGPVFAVAVAAIGALCLRELFTVTGESGRSALAAYIALAALCAAAYFGDSYQLLLVLMASIPLVFVLSVWRRPGPGLVAAVSIAVLALVWIALPLAHAIQLRGIPDHGAALVVNVLIGTFVSDTAAYATGRMFGHRKIFPRISPNKTLEGLIGGFVIGALSVWFAGLYQDWLSGTHALILGATIAAAAPLGDLFESALKRDIGVKDTGTLFGPHGGLLDRLDAALFTIVVGYYVSVALVL